MHDHLDIHHHGQKIVVLWGFPGFGKTQLALRYRNQNEKQYKCTMWADASSPGSMRDSFLAIAQEMDNTITPISEERRVLPAVKRWVNKNTNGNWLLILDGYDNDSFDIRPFFPSQHTGRVIVTTVWSKITIGLDAHGIEVQGIDKSAGAELLSQKANIPAHKHCDDPSKTPPLLRTSANWLYVQSLILRRRSFEISKACH